MSVSSAPGTSATPTRAVVGIGGFTGALTAFGFQRLTRWILQNNGSNYTPVFLMCGFAYLAALFVIHVLAPRLGQARLTGRRSPVERHAARSA